MAAEDCAGFLAAARVSVAELERLLGFDLWLVSCVDSVSRPDDVHRLLGAIGRERGVPVPAGENQVVLAAAGPLAARLDVGARLPWSQTLCRPMVAGDGPWFAPDIARVPAYAQLRASIAEFGLGDPRSYLGGVLRRADGSVLGTVCAYGRRVLDAPSSAGFEHVHLVAQLLSAVLAAEERVAQREQAVRRAYELAEHDPLTGLLNARGWQRALGREQERIGRYGSAAGILLVGATGEPGSVAAAAEVLTRVCRPSDALARLEDDLFAVLAVEADILAVRALAARLARALRSASVPAVVGVAARRVGEDLTGTTDRARSALRTEARRRRALRAG